MSMVYESVKLKSKRDEEGCRWLVSKNERWAICIDIAEMVFGKIKMGKTYRLYISKKKKSDYKKVKVQLDWDNDAQIKVKSEWEDPESLPQHVVEMFGKLDQVWVKLVKV